ncbi:MAG: N-acetylmuramoyl-L-alanine amidase [bacterium]
MKKKVRSQKSEVRRKGFSFLLLPPRSLLLFCSSALLLFCSSFGICFEKILIYNSDANLYVYAPYLQEEELISLKEASSAFKAAFDFNPVIQEASLKKDGIKCFLWANKDRAILDKKEITLSSCPKLISSKIYVPVELLKAFAERFNMKLDFDKNQIVIAKKLSLANTNNGFWHILKDGETLWRVSQNYGVELSSLLSLNKIIDPRFVIPGTMLYIPNPALSKEDENPKPQPITPELTTPILEKKPEDKSILQKYGIKKIVLDPGHGGKDPGAIGKSGVKEKDVVLDIALRLAKELKKNLPDTEIILTRDADYYVPLAERTGLANFKKADLFVSIHANAAFSRAASGFEVYHLSAIASDKYSEELAETENMVVERFKEKKSSLTNIILKDIAQTEFINESIELGLLVQNKACSGLSMKNRGVKSAFFYVLRDAKMPAILIETGFLSNASEEARMKDEGFKKALVNIICDAITNYKEQYEKKLVER